MGDQQHSAAELAVELTEQLKDLCGRFAVEVAGWLVDQQQGRTGYQCSGDRNSLLLPAGELIWLAFFHALQAHTRQQIDGPPTLFRYRFSSSQHERHQHVFQHRGRQDDPQHRIGTRAVWFDDQISGVQPERREVRVEMRIWRAGGREGIIKRTERSRHLYWGRLIVGYLLFRSERKSGYQSGYQIRKP